ASNTLGAGFLEKVYQRALLHELRLRGIRAAAEVSFPVTYKGHGVGEYFGDILVEDVLVIELKCAVSGRVAIISPVQLFPGHYSSEVSANWLVISCSSAAPVRGWVRADRLQPVARERPKPAPHRLAERPGIS
ncbi:MAG: GxxExxY protein, partial [Armatimonadetes bacterium]|nr:GxxExxY protein [Armatimonadota bacterium]